LARGANSGYAQGHIVEQLFLVDDGSTTWIHTEAQRCAPLIEYLEKMKFMLDVMLKINLIITQCYGQQVRQMILVVLMLSSKSELADTVTAFNKAHTQVGIWALEALRVAQGRARLLFEVDHKSIPMS
jgi:hypothetical protein